MTMIRQLAWTAWALVPVAALAFHFGPGQDLAALDLAARRQAAAIDAERDAAEAQSRAYAAHLAAIEARRAAFLDDDPALDARVEAATTTEARLYAAAADAWESAADAFQQVEDLLVDRSGPGVERIRWSKGRALVRSGDIWGGAAELEDLVIEIEGGDRGQPGLARAAREELAIAHYFGARLMRLAGEPAADWRAESAKARQHFRYLAETAAARGADLGVVRGLEDNVERVLDLEQQDRSELEGNPLPRESPGAARGNRPGRGNQEGRSRRPPTRRDGRGAGAIGRGW